MSDNDRMMDAMREKKTKMKMKMKKARRRRRCWRKYILPAVESVDYKETRGSKYTMCG